MANLRHLIPLALIKKTLFYSREPPRDNAKAYQGRVRTLSCHLALAHLEVVPDNEDHLDRLPGLGQRRHL